MANHKSARKRARQTLKRTKVNRSLLKRFRNNVSEYNSALDSKKTAEIQKIFSAINSSIAKAAKKGVISKKLMSRKLSSLSNKIK